MNQSPLTAAIGFLIGTFGLIPMRYENDVIDVTPIPPITNPNFIGPVLPPANWPPPASDQSSGQGTGQGTGSGIGGSDWTNPFGNWDGNNNAAQTSMGTAGNDFNNNGIPDDIDALLGGR
ncbi:MAG: hypothetical protein [Circular genetic element sp.]|nr:MAG: hypothetical protein [Circular genetic element sp.]|tara:strand:- start:494 stop:853 length:360 start_codon:yes stop_codon:yes gene_type:complete